MPEITKAGDYPGLLDAPTPFLYRVRARRPIPSLPHPYPEGLPGELRAQELASTTRASVVSQGRVSLAPA